MDISTPAGGPAAMVERLRQATNARDLDALVDCFDPDYVNETPVHPDRGFRGREQVRDNWEQLYQAIPDLRTEVVRSVVDADTVWSEWEHRGTRGDGSEHLLRGVVIFGVVGGRATWARFYLEPVEHGSGDVNQAIQRQTHAGGTR